MNRRAAEAQPVEKMHRVGVLSALSGSDPQVKRSFDAFRHALRELRYVEGRSIAIEYRWAEGKVERLLDLATQLVRLAAGLVASLARPGGNITGVAIISHELVGKELELLREVVPKVSRVAVLWNPTNPGNILQMREAEVSAQTLGVRLQSLGARGPGEVDQAFAAMTRERAGALSCWTRCSWLNDNRSRTSRQRIACRLYTDYGCIRTPEG